MSEFEYNNLLFQISQRLDNINAAKQLLVICRGKLAARNEESIPTLSLFEELEEGGFLSFDRLTVLKAILEGVEEWALLEKVEKFACKRKEYNNLLEQIIRVLDELNDLERLISICRRNITERRRASIHDVRSLFKELESNDCLGIDCLEIVKEILTQTEKTDLLKEVEEFEQRQSRERRKAIAAAMGSSPFDKLVGVFTIKTVFRGIGGSILAFSAFKLLRRGSTYDQLVTAISTCILPAGIKLIEMAEGSVNLKVQAENRLALDSLWRMYKNGTLKARLEALFVTDEMRELAGGEGVEVIVTIDEREYENARYELTTEARDDSMDKEEKRLKNLDQEKYDYIQDYLEQAREQTKDVDRQSVTTDTASDSGISGSNNTSSEVGTEDISDSSFNLCLKDLSKAVTAEISFRLETDFTALEQFCQSFGLDRQKLHLSMRGKSRQEIIELFPDTPVTLLRDVFRKLELYDLVELLEKVRPSTLRAIPAKEMDKLLNANNKRPTKFFSKAEVLIIDYFGFAAVEKANIERIGSFFKDLNSKSQVAEITAEVTFERRLEDINKLRKRSAMEWDSHRGAEDEETMLKELLKEKFPNSGYKGSERLLSADLKRKKQLLSTVYEEESAMTKRLEAVVLERGKIELKINEICKEIEQKVEELKGVLPEQTEKFKVAISSVLDKRIRQPNDKDSESTLLVVIQSSNCYYFVSECIEETQKFLAEKLSLIPNTKLVISDYWSLPDKDYVQMFQDTLHFLIHGRGAFPTMLEVLNKRWQTLDLISVCREIKRTLPVQHELFYQGDRSTFDYHGCQIVDILTCLPKLQKVDP